MTIDDDREPFQPAVLFENQRLRSLLSRDRVFGPGFEHPVHMRTHPRGIDAVHMDGDRRLQAGVAQSVDLFKSGSGEAAITNTSNLGAQGDRLTSRGIESKQCFDKIAVAHRIGAPRVVCVDRAELAGYPDQRNDCETALRIGTKHVAGVTVRTSRVLASRQQARIGRRGLKGGDDAMCLSFRFAFARSADFCREPFYSGV